MSTSWEPKHEPPRMGCGTLFLIGALGVTGFWLTISGQTLKADREQEEDARLVKVLRDRGTEIRAVVREEEHIQEYVVTVDPGTARAHNPVRLEAGPPLGEEMYLATTGYPGFEPGDVVTVVYHSDELPRVLLDEQVRYGLEEARRRHTQEYPGARVERRAPDLWPSW
ncbi:hypothetical protein [Myceligenerans pegani]|uniref:DUF3592 domain-containing protein n=1 Tax=Myceligenerans pegani TaxID=2776917 RepID=A0ABR9MXG1_9MICO|nr:hypothetical protein [Myceligenerans sp. TRM 65318]MBE1875815.1 hypothetical protein [Myceligenerans sp. TRM 65318]MBE3018086.1 hypothetical protein [Myceligenerans sp. TRM 65318]